MKRSFVLVLVAVTLALASVGVVYGASDDNNGNHNGWYKNGRIVGVPDAGAVLPLLIAGMTAVGAYSALLKRKGS